MKTLRSLFQFELLCLVALALQLLAVSKTSAASFVLTAPMSVASAYHTATLLQNGKVLVAGGANDSSSYSLSSAQLFDPVTRTWTATGSMLTNRYWHAATLLPNGKVLVAGGVTVGGGALSSAELYDPTSGTWSPTGGMGFSRARHTGTLLANGKVLVAGGSGSGTTELYDPVSGTWSVTGTLNAPRSAHTATLLPNGKVIIVGGQFSSTFYSTELYDPVSGTWAVTGALTATNRYWHTATLLSNGKVLAVGGFTSGGQFSSTELYDPVTGTWTATGNLNNARYRHTATLLPNGKVMVAAGYIGGGSDAESRTVELYDQVTGQWTTVGTVRNSRYDHTATLLSNGEVLLASGTYFLGTSPNGEGYRSSAEVYTDYNQIIGQPLPGGDMQLSYLGVEGTNYALDRTLDLTPVINWVPQATNSAGAGGVLVFTNTPVPSTNNFWRVRSVP